MAQTGLTWRLAVDLLDKMNNPDNHQPYGEADDDDLEVRARAGLSGADEPFGSRRLCSSAPVGVPTVPAQAALSGRCSGGLRVSPFFPSLCGSLSPPSDTPSAPPTSRPEPRGRARRWTVSDRRGGGGLAPPPRAAPVFLKPPAARSVVIAQGITEGCVCVSVCVVEATELLCSFLAALTRTPVHRCVGGNARVCVCVCGVADRPVSLPGRVVLVGRTAGAPGELALPPLLTLFPPLHEAVNGGADRGRPCSSPSFTGGHGGDAGQ